MPLRNCTTQTQLKYKVIVTRENAEKVVTLRDNGWFKIQMVRNEPSVQTKNNKITYYIFVRCVVASNAWLSSLCRAFFHVLLRNAMELNAIIIMFKWFCISLLDIISIATIQSRIKWYIYHTNTCMRAQRKKPWICICFISQWNM